jgi:glycosyltransferase involved in cell wall biosynthesis
MNRADASAQTAGAPSLAVVVPALNEAQTIERVVASLAAVAESIYVVDDGSTDGTGPIAARAGAVVLRNERPTGYDAAIAAGLNRAFGDGALAVVTCDADGQHRSADLLRVATLVTGGRADFATGIRDRYNRPIEALIGFVSGPLLGSRDPFCGLKCYSRAFFDRVGPFPADMHVGLLPLVLARRLGLRIELIEIHVEQRIDRPRFAPRISADLKLMWAFAAALRAGAQPRPLGRQ